MKKYPVMIDKKDLFVSSYNKDTTSISFIKDSQMTPFEHKVIELLEDYRKELDKISEKLEVIIADKKKAEQANRIFK